jgi:hypothetical protein
VSSAEYPTSIAPPTTPAVIALPLEIESIVGVMPAAAN